MLNWRRTASPIILGVDISDVAIEKPKSDLHEFGGRPGIATFKLTSSSTFPRRITTSFSFVSRFSMCHSRGQGKCFIAIATI